MTTVRQVCTCMHLCASNSCLLHAWMHMCQLKLLLAGVLLALAENLPLGILQIVYSQRITTRMDLLDMLSLVMSWYA